MSRITLENPYIVTKVTEYTEFEIKTIFVDLNKPCATFIIIIYTDMEADTDVKEFIMEGNDYTNWNLNNEYATSFIKRKLSES